MQSDADNPAWRPGCPGDDVRCGDRAPLEAEVGESVRPRGFGLVEVMIAIFLTAVGVMAIMSMQPSAWRTAARADYMGRAAELLAAELERQEALVMNPCNAVTTGATTNPSVRSSGQTASLSGDAVYAVTTTIAQIAANVYQVTVVVAWNNGANSVSETIVVSRQDFFRSPAGCLNA